MEIGDRVKLIGDYAYGKTGTIIEKKLNLFGRMLYIVDIDKDQRGEFDTGHNPCQYFQELEPLPKE